ncbi:Undefined function [Listeria monocytogenes N53-1]|nr:Undefined function [Listeria monocytogenes N53-1]
MKKRWIIVLGITVITIFGLGVKFYMDEEKLNKEMMNVVYSDEAKQVFEYREKSNGRNQCYFNYKKPSESYPKKSTTNQPGNNPTSSQTNTRHPQPPSAKETK